MEFFRTPIFTGYLTSGLSVEKFSPRKPLKQFPNIDKRLCSEAVSQPVVVQKRGVLKNSGKFIRKLHQRSTWNFIKSRLRHRFTVHRLTVDFGKILKASLSSTARQLLLHSQIQDPANIYLFKVNNRNTSKRCEICSKLTIATLGRRQKGVKCVQN